MSGVPSSAGSMTAQSETAYFASGAPLPSPADRGPT
jgi:hypothetical protein